MAIEKNSGAEHTEEPLAILAVDDSRFILSMTESALEKIENITIDTCLDPLLAIEKCKKTKYDVLIIDYIMPDLDGIKLARRLRQIDNYDTVQIVMVTSDINREVRLQALKAGVNDFLNKPFDPLELRARVANMLALRLAQRKLARLVGALSSDVARAAAEIRLSEKEMFWRLALAIEMRDGSTGKHISRMAKISRCLAKGLGLSEEHYQLIYHAAPLHDVGKIGIPDTILGKPGKLTEMETLEMRKHVEIGKNILGGGDSKLLQIAANIAGGHHEKWNGAGYPAGLSGEAIPIEARIVAVADVFDALCSERPYKAAWPLDHAFAEILAQSGSHFDPACVRVFQNLQSEIYSIVGGEERPDEVSPDTDFAATEAIAI